MGRQKHKKRKSELRTNPKGEAEVGEDNHGIEPESSEQGTFSQKHLKTWSSIQAQDRRNEIRRTGLVYKPKKTNREIKYWYALATQEKK